jgi:hypothetical protein
MGCDIHATIEYDFYSQIKNKLDDQQEPWWFGFARDVQIQRNYSLFTILAGVRDYDREGYTRPIIAAPRGIPKDASFEYAEEVDEWEGDGHSHSYVTARELAEWKPEEGTTYTYADEDWYWVVKYLGEKYGQDNVRLCFFFDN